jgi:hypothetical protein
MGQELLQKTHLQSNGKGIITNLMGKNLMGKNLMGKNLMGKNLMGKNLMGKNLMGKELLQKTHLQSKSDHWGEYISPIGRSLSLGSFLIQKYPKFLGNFFPLKKLYINVFSDSYGHPALDS